MSLISEFKTFAMRGNVVDLAVGVVIGAAFGKIVTALVNGIVMPPLGLLIGGVNFSELAVTLKEAVVAADGTVTAPAVLLNYGGFIQTLFDFTIIAFAIFLVVKAMNSMQKKAEEAPAAPPAPSNEEKLLSEIRDLLKQRAE
jgi:large conductance mechanosensitive channel